MGFPGFANGDQLRGCGRPHRWHTNGILFHQNCHLSSDSFARVGTCMGRDKIGLYEKAISMLSRENENFRTITSPTSRKWGTFPMQCWSLGVKWNEKPTSLWLGECTGESWVASLWFCSSELIYLFFRPDLKIAYCFLRWGSVHKKETCRKIYWNVKIYVSSDVCCMLKWEVFQKDVSQWCAFQLDSDSLQTIQWKKGLAKISSTNFWKDRKVLKYILSIS